MSKGKELGLGRWGFYGKVELVDDSLGGLKFVKCDFSININVI